MKKPYRYHVFPCAGPKCGAETGERYKGMLKDLIPDRKARGIRMSTSSCQGMCELGPNVAVYPEGVIYHRVSPADIERIAREHLCEGRIVEELAVEPETPREPEEPAHDPPPRPIRDPKDS